LLRRLKKTQLPSKMTLCAVVGIHVTGYVGSEVKVSCSYGQGYESYEKYLCKSNCGNGDVLIKTSESRKNKYVIHDDKTARIFTTTIVDLRSVDAGKYWCGVSKFGKDIYTEVELKLKPCCIVNVCSPSFPTLFSVCQFSLVTLPVLLVFKVR
uniref:Immunoglobulin V-set domain-containing protein n=1 Tax=Haplochromis burtoni TaxID=8153 RepID=A0A3Q2W5L0_HAPBU